MARLANRKELSSTPAMANQRRTTRRGCYV
nr:MAG TPA: hypothetical protein [Caudoviricetes sp.]